MSDLWKCPKCGAVFRKGMAGMFAPEAMVIGTATCGSWGAKFQQSDVYAGKYDVGGSAALGGSGESAPKMTPCEGCGRSIEQSNLTCPYCGCTQWMVIIVVGIFSIVVLIGAVLGYLNIENTVWRNLVGWGGGIVGGLLLLLVIEDYKKASCAQNQEKILETPEACQNDCTAVADLLDNGIKLEGKGYYAAAINLYQEIIQKFPDAEFAKTAQMRLEYSREKERNPTLFDRLFSTPPKAPDEHIKTRTAQAVSAPVTSEEGAHQDTAVIKAADASGSAATGDAGICDFEKGDAIDRLVQGGKFGFERSAGLLIKPKPGREIKFGVRVTGTVRCHGCGADLPFAAEVIFPIGMSGGWESRCGCCSVVSFSNCGHDVSGTRCRVLVAPPVVEPFVRIQK